MNRRAAIPVLVLATALASCGKPSPPSVIVLNGEWEQLDAYAPGEGDRKQVLVSGNPDEAKLDVPALNGQICFDPSGRFLVMGDDAHQPDPPPGWAILAFGGKKIGELSAKRVNRIAPTYQTGASGAENFGCGFLKDGRLLTADVGNEGLGAANGQLVLWFPPWDQPNPRYCKLDVAVGTAGGIFVDEQDRIYLASARVEPGIYRYTGPFPTGDDAAHGCGKLDALGSPLADAVTREMFIPKDDHIPTPNQMVRSPAGTYYVSSVLNGVIAEYDAGGKFLREILAPPHNESLGPKAFSTGSPMGLGVDRDGTIYYADIGLVLANGDIGPGDQNGSLRRIRFANGKPQPPETIDSGLNFPDGIGLFFP